MGCRFVTQFFQENMNCVGTLRFSLFFNLYVCHHSARELCCYISLQNPLLCLFYTCLTPVLYLALSSNCIAPLFDNWEQLRTFLSYWLKTSDWGLRTVGQLSQSTERRCVIFEHGRIVSIALVTLYSNRTGLLAQRTLWNSGQLAQHTYSIYCLCVTRAIVVLTYKQAVDTYKQYGDMMENGGTTLAHIT